MLSIIIFASILLIIQLMMPLFLNMNKLMYFTSNRAENIAFSEATERVKRAGSNLTETIPIFMTLAVLSIVYSVDNTTAALFWLISRVMHFLCYAFGISLVRSASFLASLICLGLMAENLYISQISSM